jgi:hypothetical protein
MIAVGMIRWTKAEMTVMFAYIQWTTVQVGTHQATAMSPAGIWGLLAVLIGTCAFFAVWMVKAR